MKRLIGFFQYFHWPFNFFLFKFFLRLEVRGRENLKKVSPFAIFAANHISWWDGFSLAAAFPYFSGFIPYFSIVHKYFYTSFRKPIGWFLYALGAMPVERGVGLENSLGKFIAVLKKRKKPVLIFPEGTVSKEGKLLPGKRGVAYMALYSGAPVVPVAITGVSRVKLREFLFRRRKMTITFGEPFYLKDYAEGSYENDEALLQGVDVVIGKIRNLLPEEMR